MDNSFFNLLSNLLSAQNPNLSSLFCGNKQSQEKHNPASKLYPPEAGFSPPPEQQPQPNIMTLISSMLGKNGTDIANIISKQSTKKEEDSSPSDVIL